MPFATHQTCTTDINHPELDPQCLSCKKRRVKCDSRATSCSRCNRGGIICPGYGGGLKVIVFRPRESRNRRGKDDDKKKSQESQKEMQIRRTGGLQVNTITQETNTTQEMIPHINNPKHNRNHDIKSTKCISPTTTTPSSNPDELALLSSIHAYNTIFLPKHYPPPPPFHRQKVNPSHPWHLLPKILTYNLIVTLRATHAAAAGIDPLSRADTCHYRGLGLRELQSWVVDAVADVQCVALALVVCLMWVDLSSCATGNWTQHFEAARRITRLKGGLGACLRAQSVLAEPLVNFLVVDVFSSSTCRSELLFPSEEHAHDHAGYVALLPGLKGHLLASYCLCPVRVLEAIVRTNLLRSELASGVDSVTAVAETASDIHALLSSFSAPAWATHVLYSHRTRPLAPATIASPATHTALESLAQCYQCAAQIYLVLGTTSSPSLTSLTLPPLLEALKTHSRLLLQQAAFPLTADTPLHRRLWRQLAWPLFVGAYAAVGWGGDEEELDARVEEVAGFARLAGSRGMAGAVEWLRGLREERRREREGEVEGTWEWEWDRGFGARCGFTI